MKTLLTSLTTCVVLLSAGVVLLLTSQHVQNRQLTSANSQLTRELTASETTVTALRDEKATLSEKLEALTLTEAELRGRVDALEEAARSAAEASPRPYRVRAFLGQENVGGAWIIPHNVTRDTESGRYLYEPVLVIDESARDHFTVHHTNVVERTLATTEIYDNYGAYPYYYYVTPGRPGGTNRPPVQPGPPSRPRGTTDTIAQQPNARARLFAPPMSTVNSRPQVIGTPATSPINQRVFAP